ncbi:sigma-54 dependent transcriptional regulator, partial [Aquabacterium sp. A08]
HLLVVDDEPDLRTLYELTLLKVGYRVDTADTLASARARLAERHYQLVITDMRLPDGLGLELVRQVTAEQRPEKTIVITAYGSAHNAVEALKAGAFDYLTKPVELPQLRQAVATALQGQPSNATQGHHGSAAPAPQQAGPSALTPQAAAALACIVGHSAPMVAVRQHIQRVAPTMAPVLVLGESGTGKELVARALHACSHRAAGPFVAVNCGAIPENLMEAEFFGVRKGAYTGATADRPGYFQAAQGGTLFLDELGDLPLPMQAKLLRAIQERQVRPLGATQEEATDVRLVSATHHELARAVQQGRFRQDLYYRLNVIELRIPPLRERASDLPDMAHALLARLAQRNGLPQPPTLAPDALAALARHPFPGNVRELENTLERALALHTGPTLGAEAIQPPPSVAPPPPGFADSGFAPTVPAPLQALPPGTPWPADAEPDRAHLAALLAHNRWNQSRTARQLGWTLAKLRYWMQRLGLGDSA